MIDESINKAKVLFAQGENELTRAKGFAEANDDGKARTSSRRAAGFFIEGLQLIERKSFYGKSFMSLLRAIAVDEEVPENVKLSARTLVEKPINLNGSQAVENAENIIAYCKQKFEKTDGN